MSTTPGFPSGNSRWTKIRDLFDEASRLEPEARESWLRDLTDDAEIRQTVHRLLAAHERFDHSEMRPGQEHVDDALSRFASFAATEADTAIGDFRVGRLLGEGGMGRVYYATRTIGGNEQKVALKIVPFALRGARAVEQLRLERGILAALDHPNIARLIDAGELPDGRPWFAMEYVDGAPITRYCNEHALDIRARLGLFLDVCEAVAYAHRQLVLHRDIKPGNVLVDTQGRVRLVDFGIGKSIAGQAQGSETTIGSGFFSLYSATPEQLLGRATTVATDVYGLGCLVYELLAGRTAFVFGERSREDVVRAILDEPPQRPSDAATTPAQRVALHGDLDTIVAQSLRKNPADRYRSVDELADDVRNVLDYRPIAARSSERWYRAKMFVRRHRATAAVAAVLGFAVLATTAVSIVQSQRAAAERDRAVAALANAQLQRDHARRVTDFLVNSFKAAEPTQGHGGVVSADDLLAAAVRSLEEGAAADNLLLRATIAQTLAHLFYMLDRVADTKRQAQIGADAVTRLPDATGEVVARQFLADGQAAFLTERYDESAKLAGQGLEKLGDSATVEDGDLLYNLWKLRARAAMASPSAALSGIATARQALEVLSARKDVTPDQTDWFRFRIASDLSNKSSGRPEALSMLLALIAEQNARPRVDDANRIETMRMVSRVYLRLSQFQESLFYAEEAYRLHLARFGEGNSRTRHLLMSLSKAYSNAGRRDEAMVLFRKLVEISRQLFGDRSTSICQHYYDLADNYVSEYLEYRLGEYFLTKATLEACPPEATYLPYVYRRLGEVMLELGRYDAEPYVLEGLRLMAQTRPGSDDHHFAMANLAFMYFRKYRFDEAATLLTPAVVAEVRAINPAFAGNTFRELQHEVDEMAAFYGM